MAEFPKRVWMVWNTTGSIAGVFLDAPTGDWGQCRVADYVPASELARVEKERDYLAGYAADLAAIDRVLDEHDAPHDCEDGVSLSPKRIRLLAEERDTARARIAELERELRARRFLDKWVSESSGWRSVYRCDGDGYLHAVVIWSDPIAETKATGPDHVALAIALGWEDGHGK